MYGWLLKNENERKIVQYNGGLNPMWVYNHGCHKTSAVKFCLKMRFFALIAEYLTDQLAAAMKNAELNTF